MSRKQCRKGPSGAPPFATMVILSALLATSHCWLLSHLPHAPGKAPGRHIGGCAGAWVQSDNLPRQAPCRGRCLVVSGSLSLTGSCRDAWRVAASSSKCLGWPSRQAPLAGALSPWLEYFVLEWLQRNHGGFWWSPVHKFGILGYPYFSTPTRIFLIFFKKIQYFFVFFLISGHYVLISG